MLDINREEIDINKEIETIIKKYKAGSEEPLDGDEVYVLSHRLRRKLDLIEGNITDTEYKDYLLRSL